MSDIKREDLNFIFQNAQRNRLKSLYHSLKERCDIRILQAPTQQTLLIPVHDPISGGEFYAGEMLVTTTIVTVENHKGWAMVQDDDEELSLYIAVCDACFEAGIFKKEITELCNETIINMQKAQKIINQKVNSTRVNFDLM